MQIYVTKLLHKVCWLLCYHIVIQWSDSCYFKRIVQSKMKIGLLFVYSPSGHLWWRWACFGLSFWWHPFTVEDPLLSKSVFRRNKLIYILDGLRASFHFWVNHSFKCGQGEWFPNLAGSEKLFVDVWLLSQYKMHAWLFPLVSAHSLRWKKGISWKENKSST